ncbi:AMP-binding protein [Candidatus Babeliales bacterium]|nr:AMP-binding protein [Candidatus Babeliales bacterium]
MQTLVSLFKNSVDKFSKKPILSMRPRWRIIRWSFGELNNFSSGIASVLEKYDVGFGDKVILISPNSPMWAGAFFGCLLKGAVIVPLNPQSPKDFVKKIIKETKAKVLLKSTLLKLGDLGIPAVEIDKLIDLEKKYCEFAEIAVKPEDIAEIVYTSGTTGDPKGVVLTHKNIIFNVESISKIFHLSSNDRIVSILPLFHMYEQTACLFLSIKHGVEIMYAPNVSSRAIASTLQEMRATKMLVVPEILESILRKIESKAKDEDREILLGKIFSLSAKLPYFLRRILFRKVHQNLGGKLKMFASAGAALHEDIERKWNLMGFKVYQGYGLTETSPAITISVPGTSRIGSVGKVISGVDVTISKTGEILVKGPNVFSGYYNNEEKTKEVFDEEGCFKTGDMGNFDKDGFLYISGRAKYMIVTPSGANVYPEDLEIELKKIPGVKDAAVVGLEVNHHMLIHASLLGDIKDSASIVEKANNNLASYQKIQDWSVWPEEDFPRSATRKVKKEEVIKWVISAGRPTTKKSTGTVSSLIKLLASVSGKDPETISEDTNLSRDLHFDSLMRIELVSRLEESEDALVEEQQITNRTTVKDLRKLIEQSKTETKKQKFKGWLLSWPAVILREVLERLILFPLYRLMIKVEVEGLDNIENLDFPVAFMSNHLSYLDGLIILKALPSKIRRRIAIAAAVDVLYKEYKWASWFVSFIFNSYPLPRTEEENIRPGLEYTGKVLDKDFSILIFPEGKISTTGDLLDLKRGAGLIRTEMNIPVVPIIISGLRDLVPMYSFWPKKRGVVKVKVGSPIKPDPDDSYIEATEEIYKAMKSLS